MAHECPDCCEVCYCNTDNDDMMFNNPEDIIRCVHCDGSDVREDDRDEAADGFDDIAAPNPDQEEIHHFA